MNNFFKDYGILSDGILNLSAREAYSLCKEGAILLDVRKESMTGYKIFDVPTVIYCPHHSILTNLDLLPMDKPMIVADAVGLHSKEAVITLNKKGFELVANLAGGIVDWERDGFPLIIDKGEALTGACLCRLRPRKSFNKGVLPQI